MWGSFRSPLIASMRPSPLEKLFQVTPEDQCSPADLDGPKLAILYQLVEHGPPDAGGGRRFLD
jgi:hypothetical protein